MYPNWLDNLLELGYTWSWVMYRIAHAVHHKITVIWLVSKVTTICVKGAIVFELL